VPGNVAAQQEIKFNWENVFGIFAATPTSSKQCLKTATQ